mgnify:CR=1 FL=1
MTRKRREEQQAAGAADIELDLGLPEEEDEAAAEEEDVGTERGSDVEMGDADAEEVGRALRNEVSAFSFSICGAGDCNRGATVRT